MNYIEKFLQELNIKRNECFKLRYKDTDETIDGVFYFDDNFFLKQRIGTMVLCIDDSVLSHLLIGDLIIEAPSFSPENGDQFYFNGEDGMVCWTNFNERNLLHLLLRAYGFTYRTREQAERNKDRDMDRLELGRLV